MCWNGLGGENISSLIFFNKAQYDLDLETLLKLTAHILTKDILWASMNHIKPSGNNEIIYDPNTFT